MSALWCLSNDVPRWSRVLRATHDIERVLGCCAGQLVEEPEFHAPLLIAIFTENTRAIPLLQSEELCRVATPHALFICTCQSTCLSDQADGITFSHVEWVVSAKHDAITSHRGDQCSERRPRVNDTVVVQLANTHLVVVKSHVDTRAAPCTRDPCGQRSTADSRRHAPHRI